MWWPSLGYFSGYQVYFFIILIMQVLDTSWQGTVLALSSFRGSVNGTWLPLRLLTVNGGEGSGCRGPLLTGTSRLTASCRAQSAHPVRCLPKATWSGKDVLFLLG